MPGICGNIDSTAGGDVAAQVEDMLGRLRHHDWYRTELGGSAADGVGLGRISLGFVNTAPQPVNLPESGVMAVMDGELYDVADQRRKLVGAGIRCTGESHAEVLLRGFLHEGPSFLAQVEGKFAAALWDPQKRRLTLVSDRFGMKPLYYSLTRGRFLFASEIKALLVDSETSTSLNVRGLAQFLTFGHLWCNDTLYESIRALPGAACVTFEVESGEVLIERYWSPQSRVSGGQRKEDHLGRIDAAFKRSVDQCSESTGHLGLSLSGGLDARSILAAIDHERVHVDSVCLGIEGSLDHRSASRLAALAGSPYHPYVLDERFLSQFDQHLNQMVHLTDGHYLSQCIVMPTLPFYRDLGIRVLLRGHAGELMHMRKAYNFSLDGEAMGIRDEYQLEGWLFRHLRGYMLDGLDGPLLAGVEPDQVEGLARESLREGLAESAGWSPLLHRIWHLFLTQRLRRETAMSMVKIGSVAETRLPFLNGELIDALLAAPPELKIGEEIQTHILRRHFPAFLNVTNVNTGAPVGAGALAKRLHSLKLRVFAKLGVKGYQPYERLGLWLRRELRPLLTSTLLDARCLDRGIFVPDTVRQAVSDHLADRRNHTYLLMALLIFETGQRVFVDRSAPLRPRASGVSSPIAATRS